ncbi:MAG: class I SAM-dependent methyltransferase [Candidatus Peregrinibacteria bacterium]|nr:class I SAM-dependent methyltransferase [Candidatus Peregrinibacteria bacterium]
MLIDTRDPGEPSFEESLRIYERRRYEIERFQLFNETFHPQHCNEILNLGCGGDAAPTRAFPGKRVINVDYCKSNIDVLKAQEPNAEIHVADAKEFIPPTSDQKVDAIIYAGAFAKEGLRHLRTGGYLLVSATAIVLDEIRSEPGMKLIGIVWKNDGSPTPGHHYRINTEQGEDLQSYLEPIQTDADVEALRVEDPVVVEQAKARHASGDVLGSAVKIAAEICGYIPRKKGHSINRPDMFIFQKNS